MIVVTKHKMHIQSNIVEHTVFRVGEGQGVSGGGGGGGRRGGRRGVKRKKGVGCRERGGESRKGKGGDVQYRWRS